MPANVIESMLRDIDAGLMTNVFLIALIAVFLISLFFKRKHQHQLFTAYTPTLLTSVGILGTFAGIITGLLDFNTNDIDGSIGPLLAGLKTAFISSLAGMFLSIVYKGMVSVGLFIPKVQDVMDDDDVSNVDFYKIMKDQVRGLDQLKKAIAGDDDSSLVNVMKLQRAESNDHYRVNDAHLKVVSSSLDDIANTATNQQKEFTLFQERLWRQMQDFADVLSKSATEQVIDALKQVITDFNNNLTEQFGENFKALNEAVLKLVEWQENYKGQLEDMREKYALGVEAISQTETSVAHISEEARAIPVAMNDLKQVVEVNQHQIGELDRHLEAFAAVRDKAVEAVPEIREQIDQAIKGAQSANDTLAKGMQDCADNMAKTLGESSEEFRNKVDATSAALTESAQTTANSSEQIRDQFKDALTDINNNMRNMLDELQKDGKEMNETFKVAGQEMTVSFREAGQEMTSSFTQAGSKMNTSFKEAGDLLIKDTRNWNKEFESSLSSITSNLESTIKEQATAHTQQADKVFRGLEKTIEEALSSTGESVQKQVDMIDKTAGQEIEKVMTSMGSALSSIANQFVNDYSKLVDQMNRVVNRQ